MMHSDRFWVVWVLLSLVVLLVASSTMPSDALSAPRVYLSFKGKRWMFFSFLNPFLLLMLLLFCVLDEKNLLLELLSGSRRRVIFYSAV